MGERCGCGAARVEGLPTCGPCTVVRMRRERDRLARGMFDPRERVLLATLDDRDEEIAALRAERDRMRAVLSALVHAVEDSCLHFGGCPYAECDEDDLPEDAECECFEPQMSDALAALGASALDREEREAAPASGDPELAAAVARLDGAQAGGHLMKRGVLWRGIVADGRLHIGTLRDVLIALARDVSEEGR